MARLTDLELTVLGIVWKKAPCTAYAIMREFASSPSSYYRGSAGAIYPLVQRLAERGQLLCSDEMQGRRPRRTYRISRTGLATLRRWLTPPLPDQAAAITFDPLRTRTYFLGALSAKQRRAFIREAEKKLGEQSEVVRAECQRYRRHGDEFSALAMEGALQVVQARITWMQDMGRHWDER